MSAIDQIVKVNISQLAQAVTQTAFSIPLILGPTMPASWNTDVVRTYTSAAALLTDGFTTSSPEYIYALRLLSQSIVPAQFLVGKRSALTSTTIVSDLTAITAVNNTWYGLVVAGASDADITAVAAYIESVKKIFLAVSSTSAIAATGSSDLGSTLKAAAYKRTALIYAVNGVTQGIEAAWMGGQLPQTPGANNWAFKNLSGITADTLSDSAQANLIGSPVGNVTGKNVNIYQNVGGINLTQMGTTASGQFIDLTIGVDYIQSTVQNAVFAQLANSPKIPYTDDGIAVLLQAVRQPLDVAAGNGLLDPKTPIVVAAATNAAGAAPSDRLARRAPPLTFSARFSGALNAVVISGTITI